MYTATRDYTSHWTKDNRTKPSGFVKHQLNRFV